MSNKSKLSLVAAALIFSLSCTLLRSAPAPTVAPKITSTHTFTPASATPTTEPTNIPVITATPSSTFAPEPSLTPTSPPAPTLIPTFPPDFPVAFIGPGDKVLDISPWGPGVMTIVAAQANDNFMIHSHDQNGEAIDLLVNVIIGTYIGKRPINWADNGKAAMLQVEANEIGEWTIVYLPIYSDQITAVVAPGSLIGAGDDVIKLTDFTSGTVTFTSEGEDNFIVTAFNQDLEPLDLLVNEIGAYSGTKILPGDTAFLVIQASGAWSMDVAGN